MSTQLSLRIKKQYLDEIISGTKKIEYREENDFYAERLGIIEDGEVIDTKQFDTVKFYTGEKTDCQFAIVKCNGVYLVRYENEIPEGMKKGDMAYEIELGEVLKHN